MDGLCLQPLKMTSRKHPRLTRAVDKGWTHTDQGYIPWQGPPSLLPKHILNLSISLHPRGHPLPPGHHHLLSGQLQEPLSTLFSTQREVSYSVTVLPGKDSRRPLLRALRCLPWALSIKSEILQGAQDVTPARLPSVSLVTLRLFPLSGMFLPLLFICLTPTHPTDVGAGSTGAGEILVNHPPRACLQVL